MKKTPNKKTPNQDEPDKEKVENLRNTLIKESEKEGIDLSKLVLDTAKNAGHNLLKSLGLEKLEAENLAGSYAKKERQDISLKNTIKLLKAFKLKFKITTDISTALKKHQYTINILENILDMKQSPKIEVLRNLVRKLPKQERINGFFIVQNPEDIKKTQILKYLDNYSYYKNKACYSTNKEQKENIEREAKKHLDEFYTIIEQLLAYFRQVL